MKRNGKNKYLFMGPLSPPITGQSVAFTTLINVLRKEMDIEVLNISNRDSVVSSIGLLIKIFFRVLFNKYEVIYFTCSRSKFGSFRDVLLLLMSKIRKVRVVNHLHGSDFSSFYTTQSKIYRKILLWAYNSVDVSIVLVNGMENEFSDFPKMKIVVIPNCYSKDMDMLPLVKEQNEKEVRLLYLSNIMKSKGILYLLEATESLFEKYSCLKLDIAGSFMDDSFSNKKNITDEFYSKLTYLQSKYPKRIHFYGECKGDLKIQLLWMSDIFILPTFYKTEAFPISILEAMRAGNFILSTKHRYIPKIINETNGLLFEPLSSFEIVKAIEEAISDRNKMLDIQNNNISYVMINYHEQEFVGRIKDVIRN